ncbi:uncharacterized protein LOC135196036 [Macrobrachium nipponense]|uniref:uncharacterized protein LOC135196036 n=1 Tax=Macrobrachium nipponense TaxID=159736 RepID=UPI0030C7A40F
MLLRPSTFVLVAVTLGLHVASAKRTCFTSLRLKTTSGFVEKEFEGFETRAFLGTCATVKKDCPGKLLEHVKNKFGPQVNPMGGETATNMCKFFDKEILPSDDPVVDVKYKASSCGNEGYMSIGRLCCFKCIFGPFTLFQPIDNCAPTARPSWCP